MRMKTMIFTVLSVFLLTTAAWAMEPELVGTWNSSVVTHKKDGGFTKAEGKGKWIIEEVKDGAFFGKKVWNISGTDREEGFSGVIGVDGKKLYMAGHDDGVTIGDVMSPDRIMLYYLESGPKAKVMRIELKRVQ
jgi:opacity protein-like surface antigen